MTNERANLTQMLNRAAHHLEIDEYPALAAACRQAAALLADEPTPELHWRKIEGSPEAGPNLDHEPTEGLESCPTCGKMGVPPTTLRTAEPAANPQDGPIQPSLAGDALTGYGNLLKTRDAQ